MKRWRRFNPVGAAATALLMVAACAPAGSPTPLASSSPAAFSPTAASIGEIEHATGPTDVVLRFDSFPNREECNLDCPEVELVGGWFRSGPVFTLYGDGTVIFQNDNAEPPPAEGSVIRANPFRIARLNEDQIQSLLRFALLEGGLGIAREQYEWECGCDDLSFQLFSVRAGGLDKRVVVDSPESENVGPDALARDAFAALADHLRNFDRGGSFPTQVWAPDRYWGLLSKAGSVPDTGAASWPWPAIAPGEFVTTADALSPATAFLYPSGRVMAPEEAALLSLSNITGGVEGLYLVGPDDETIYSFALWPLFPDQPSRQPAAMPTSSVVPISSAPPTYSDDEADLLAVMRADARIACAPRRIDLPSRAIAGVECNPNANSVARVAAYRFRTDLDAAATYFERLAEYDVHPLSGNCRDGRSGDEAWTPGDGEDFPGSIEIGGQQFVTTRYGCFTNEDGIANYRTTCGGATYIGILGTTGDIAALSRFAWLRLGEGPYTYTPGPPTICLGNG